MKKHILFALAIVFAISMVGCKKDAEDVPTEQIQEVDDVVDNTEDVPEISNPWEECEAEDVEALVGMKFAVCDEFKDVTYRVNTDEKLAEMDFVAGELKYTARMACTDSLEDISGYNYEWTVESEDTVLDCEAITKRFIGEGIYIDLACWYLEDKGVTYCISTSDEDLDGYDILAICEEIQGTF